MNPNSISGIEAEISRRQMEEAAKYVGNEYGERQRAIWAKTLGMKVFDLIEFENDNGDDITLQVYTSVNVKDLADGMKVICQAYLLDVKYTKIFFLEGTFMKGSLLDSSGEKMIPRLQRGSYTIL